MMWANENFDSTHPDIFSAETVGAMTELNDGRTAFDYRRHKAGNHTAVRYQEVSEIL